MFCKAGALLFNST